MEQIRNYYQGQKMNWMEPKCEFPLPTPLKQVVPVVPEWVKKPVEQAGVQYCILPITHPARKWK
jgi:hypothetical protein